MVRVFYKAAGKTAEGVGNECPVKLTLSEFMALYNSIFPCKMMGADDVEVECIMAEDVKIAFRDRLGSVDPIDSTDPCKKVVQEDYKK